MNFIDKPKRFSDDDIPEWARENEDYPTSKYARKENNKNFKKTTAENNIEFNNWRFISSILKNEWCTANTAIVYSYMLSRYTWFKIKGQEYFESQETIVNALHLSESSVKRSIKMLKEHGYLDIKSIKGFQFKKNVYVVLDKYKIYDNLNKTPKNGLSLPRQSKNTPIMDDDKDSPF